MSNHIQLSPLSLAKLGTPRSHPGRIRVVDGLTLLLGEQAHADPLPICFATSSKPSASRISCAGFAVVFTPEYLEFLVGRDIIETNLPVLIGNMPKRMDWKLNRTPIVREALDGISSERRNRLANRLQAFPSTKRSARWLPQ